MFPPVLVLGLGWTELLIIFGVIVLLFGASKLPELARGSGRALRIFKAETKGLADDDDSDERHDGPVGEIDSSTHRDGSAGPSSGDASADTGRRDLSG